MKEFIGLRPKSYCYLQDNETTGKRCKGLKKCVTKKTNLNLMTIKIIS